MNIVDIHDSFAKQAALVTLAQGALLLGIVLASIGRLPPQVPLFYTRPWGETQLVAREVLLGVPVLIFLFFAITTLVFRTVQKDVFTLRILWGGCAFAAFLAVVTVIRIAF